MNSATLTLSGRRYRVVEQGVVVTYDKLGRPYRYNAARIEPVKEKKDDAQ